MFRINNKFDLKLELFVILAFQRTNKIDVATSVVTRVNTLHVGNVKEKEGVTKTLMHVVLLHLLPGATFHISDLIISFV